MQEGRHDALHENRRRYYLRNGALWVLMWAGLIGLYGAIYWAVTRIF